MATPELFAEALFTDTSSWTVIDRGPFEALLPITHVLENMLRSFDPASPGKTQLEVSECVKGVQIASASFDQAHWAFGGDELQPMDTWYL